MAYIKKLDDRLELVHNFKKSKYTEKAQKTLFVIRTKKEVEYINQEFEEEQDQGFFGIYPNQFKEILKDSWPNIRFNWKKILKNINEKSSHLPREISYEKEFVSSYVSGITDFISSLFELRPGTYQEHALLVIEYAKVLEITRDFINMMINQAKSEIYMEEETPFYWNYKFRRKSIPSIITQKIETIMDDLHLDYSSEMDDSLTEQEKKDILLEGITLASMCAKIWPENPYGFAYLGYFENESADPDLERVDQYLDSAIEKVERYFALYGSSHNDHEMVKTETIIFALVCAIRVKNSLGQYQKPLELCKILKNKCGYESAADYFKSINYLISGKWKNAANESKKLSDSNQYKPFIHGFALLETGKSLEGITNLLMGIFRFPHIADFLLEPEFEIAMKKLLNSGIFIYAEQIKYIADFKQDISGYLINEHNSGKSVLEDLLQNKEVIDYLSVIKDQTGDSKQKKQAVDEEEIRSKKFSKKLADKILKTGILNLK